MKLRTTILVCVLGLIAGILVPVAAIVDGMLERDARESLSKDLRRAGTVLEDLQSYRQDQLASQTAVTAEEPRVKAVVATEDIEPATVLDVAIELERAMGSDIFVVTDGDGRLLADTADPEAQGHDLSQLPLVARALEQGHAAAIWTDDTRIYQMQAQRLAFGSEVVGGLVVGYAIDDRVATTVRRQTGASVMVLKDGALQAAAPTGSEDPEATAAAVSELILSADEPQTFWVGGERFVARARPLPGYVGDHDVRYVVYRSLDASLAASARIIDALHTIGAFAFGVAVLLAMAVAWRLSRPVDALVQLTEQVARGALDSRATPSGPTEVRTLGAAINRMLDELARSRRQVERVNAGLEQTVAERTAEVSEILDNLTDAVLLLDAEGTIGSRYSPASGDVLSRTDLAGRKVGEFLFTEGSADAGLLGAHRFALDAMFGQPRFQWELNADHLLTSLRYTGPRGETKEFELRYAPLCDDDEIIRRVMLIVRDVTELRALRRSMECEQEKTKERVAVLTEMMGSSRDSVLGFIDDNRVRMDRVDSAVARWAQTGSSSALAELFRELHTIKGNARMLELHRISTLTHEVEDVVHALRGVPRDDPEHAPGTPGHQRDVEQLTAAIERERDLLQLFADVAEEMLRGPDHSAAREQLSLTARRIASLAAKSAPQDSSGADSLRALARLLSEESQGNVVSTRRIFEQHRGMVGEVSDRLGKQVTLRIDADDGDDLFLQPAVGGAIRDAANHALRNALDHGIERPAERVAAGKPSSGVLSLGWRTTDAGYCVEIRDDGRGVDTDALLPEVRRRGLLATTPEPSREDVLEALFAPGFSSRAQATDLSGRGVGLDAARNAVENHGGHVELRSEPGLGTTLAIYLPRAAVPFVERSGVVRQPSPHERVAA